MSNSYQNEVPPARVNIHLDLHTGGAKKKVELPLKVLSIGDYGRGKDKRPLSEKEKVSINKNNFDAVLKDFRPEATISVPNTLADDGSDISINLAFESMNDFSPEQIAKKIPQLRSLLAMRNLLRDLKSNLLDNATFRYELEKIVKDEQLSDELRAELEAIVAESTK
ncbi:MULTISPECIES: type VI secretion system contractile sheath small subunit [unclassified Gilliamella]|uniref:type VI secretion system contractile sheath small subunit n=1 Tax=unclassified Gilliamella TaxID=2685620 RepID=UPI00080DE1A1|nr:MULTISPECIES: type VI secretion system contractile sheath small subunit [Gilliamella]MCX8641265.1 type VI secretion system contractile sheath small subunit [Gilliamella sp. B3835]MCX8706976.1 type VI secretion system contractile sheath small subunit [Gilliamella sp. B3783]MCX8709807.1 type VI secretion system contractile sheath small subunit [Gilliamella sp. B3780]MCX8714152.1 type VI secretion system contractile sheath small subunit [Gilliamella sp. B3781]MCX8715959.1 type VI secretion sys